MGTNANKVQYKLNLPPDVYEVLRELADDEGITVAQLLRRGIKWVLLEEELQETGGRILIERPNEAPVQVAAL